MESGSSLEGSLAGRLLLAMPDMPDPRFQRSVILLCIHDGDGAMGIALHEPLGDITLRGLLASFDIEERLESDGVVLAGGPLEPRRGFVLHDLDTEDEHSHAIGPALALSGSLDILTAIGEDRGPRHYLVALGYAGWGAGQLEQELAAPGWFVSSADPRQLFEVEPGRRWSHAFALEGIDAGMLAASSGHA